MTKQPFIAPDSQEVSPELLQNELSVSYEVTKKLLPFLAKRGIPATPANFRLFYDYITFVNPDLNKTLNQLLEKDVKFHSQLSSSLYAFFYTNELTARRAAAISKAAAEFIGASTSMAESLQTAQIQNDRFYKTLSDASRQVAADMPSLSDSLQPYLADLMAETEATLASGGAVSAKLKEANEIIAALKEELKNQTDLAHVDDLTKLSNRRHFNMEAPKLLSEAVTSGRPLSAIAFDIDFFKRINDQWGHNYGDKVLTICAEIIKNAARGSDLAVRMGGEEFLLVCSNLNLETAAKVAERIRHSVASAEITVRGALIPVTISCGVAAYAAGEDVASFVGRADRALYQAKETGRNRVCLAAETDEPLVLEHGTPELIASAVDR